jgi:hypothetical protein
MFCKYGCSSSSSSSSSQPSIKINILLYILLLYFSSFLNIETSPSSEVNAWIIIYNLHGGQSDPHPHPLQLHINYTSSDYEQLNGDVGDGENDDDSEWMSKRIFQYDADDEVGEGVHDGG